MSPNGQTQGSNVKIPNNVYTVVLAVAMCAVVAVAVFVAVVCYMQYGIKIP